MQEPIELVDEGLKLSDEGDFSGAEQSLLRSINEYEKRHDNDGVGFALGRLGYIYEKAGETAKARSVYEKALQIGTNIPATFSALITILVFQGEFDRAFQVADIWQENSGRNIEYPAHQIFIVLAMQLARKEKYQEGLELLSRTLLILTKEKYPALYWKTLGNMGQIQEKSENLDIAMNTYFQSIKDGSTDQTTFTRLLINLEKQKKYDEALGIIRIALKVQKDAAWQNDLLKRKQRIDTKTGSIPKGSQKEIIPDFVVRKGSKNVHLIQQIQPSPQLSCGAVIGEWVYGTSGGKTPKLFAYQIGEQNKAWEIDLPNSANGIVTNGNDIVVYYREKINDGIKTEIEFYDGNGKSIARNQIPDAPSQPVMTDDRFYAGCRDGKLYAFTSSGQLLWSFLVPGGGKDLNNNYSRPFPYFVGAGKETVAFTSFSTLFVLNPSGKQLFRWDESPDTKVSKESGITISFTMGPAPLSSLSVSRTGTEISVTSYKNIYYFKNGKGLQVHFKSDQLYSVKLAEDNRLAIIADNKVYLLDNFEKVGSFSIPGRLGSFTSNKTADRSIGWCDKTLIVATYSGKVIAEIEFVKDILFASCLDDGKIIIGTRYIIVLDTRILEDKNEVISQSIEGNNKSTENMNLRERSLKQPVDEQGIRINWIEGEKFTVGTGKAFYRGISGQELTIEQLALEKYIQQGFIGFWTENNYWWEIMALLFWDVIYAKIPGTYTPQFGDFPSRLQDMPMDFFSSDFYTRRQTIIEKRIQDLTTSKNLGLVQPNIELELRKAFTENYGKPCRPIENWERFSLDTLCEGVKVLSSKQIITIMHRLLEDFSINRKGLPDLFVIDTSNNAKFIEVKGENEKVADHQFVWLHFLCEQVNIPVEICRVTARP